MSKGKSVTLDGWHKDFFKTTEKCWLVVDVWREDVISAAKLFRDFWIEQLNKVWSYTNWVRISL